MFADRIDLVDFSKEHSSFLRDEDVSVRAVLVVLTDGAVCCTQRCKPLRKTTASQYLRARRGECYWSSCTGVCALATYTDVCVCVCVCVVCARVAVAKALVMHGRRTIVLYGASYTRGTFEPIRALIRHG